MERNFRVKSDRAPTDRKHNTLIHNGAVIYYRVLSAYIDLIAFDDSVVRGRERKFLLLSHLATRRLWML